MSQQSLPSTTNLGVVSTDLPTKTLSQVSFTPTSATGTPQDVTNLTFTSLGNDIDASLDLSTIASTVLIFRLIEKVDATNDEQIKLWTWPTDNDSVTDTVLKVSIIGHGVDVRLTMQADTDESSNPTPIAIAEYVY